MGAIGKRTKASDTSGPGAAQGAVPSAAQGAVPSAAQGAVPSAAQGAVPSAALEAVPSAALEAVPGAEQNLRREPGQDAASATKNAGFFADNEHFAELIDSLETYRHIRRALDGAVAGAGRLLDVGNGGVFAYDTSLAREIVGVDLCFEETPRRAGENVTLRRGDALALDEPDGAYDVVVQSGMLHHLVGSDVDSTLANVRRAVDEAHRVLRPGGRLVVMDSCVPALAFAIERRLFGALRRLARTPLMSHPATLQFPLATLTDAIREPFGNVAVARIPVGRWTNQFNLRWPSALTPSRPYLFTATREPRRNASVSASAAGVPIS
jgi:SAM-dependent methyltransferase